MEPPKMYSGKVISNKYVFSILCKVLHCQKVTGTIILKFIFVQYCVSDFVCPNCQ